MKIPNSESVILARKFSTKQEINMSGIMKEFFTCCKKF